MIPSEWANMQPERKTGRVSRMKTRGMGERHE